MRRLILVRHAKSAWDDPALADAERPLAPRGRVAARWIGETLASEGWVPDLVLCSTSKRTRETLELALPGRPAVFSEEVYEQRDGDYLGLVRREGKDAGTLMLVGHNPATSVTAARLAGAGAPTVWDGFPTGAVAVFDLDIQDWAALEPARGVLIAFRKPPKG